MSIAYTAVLEVSEDSVLFVSGLLHAERVPAGHPHVHLADFLRGFVTVVSLVYQKGRK